MSARKEWLKLDNAATIYPAAKTRNWTALFRVSAELTEEVDAQILQRALMNTVARFPAFGMRLRMGMFWFYMEQIPQKPLVQEDVSNPCVRMKLSENHGYMFRVRYYDKRIALEVFHVLADGTGGMCFLKTLVAEYLTMRYGAQIPRDEVILDCREEPKPEETEDSFVKYARGEFGFRKETPAYHIKGTRAERHYMNIVTGLVPQQALNAEAKKYGVSMTELMTALLIEAIVPLQQRELDKRERRLPIRILVPVNMRRFYPSRTMRNFASYINPGIDSRLGSYTFEEILETVHYTMRLEATEKRLNAKFSTNVRDTRNKLLRAAPLVLKNPVMRAVFLQQGDNQSSSTISNLGLQTLPPEMGKYVTRMDFLLGSLSRTPVTCACLSYNGTTVINFTRNIQEPVVERNFFTALVKRGIPVQIESNRRQ